jgi:aminoglycoside phosphotransferase
MSSKSSSSSKDTTVASTDAVSMETVNKTPQTRNEREEFISSPLKHITQRISLSRFIYPRSIGFRTIRIGPNTFLKVGRHVDIAEAHAMRYVAQNTSIPIPRVQAAWCSEECTFIVMDYVRGYELEYAWHDMSPKTKRRVIDQLKDYMRQLRALRPPVEGRVASFLNGPLRDCSRIGLQRFGPFQSHDDFHRFIRVELQFDVMERLDHCQNIVTSHRQKYDTKFTHGDFAPRNILVKKDGTITAIVDWDSAGWYPEYWEYTKANFTPNATDDWISSIGEITGTYDVQLAGERELYTMCGYMLT